MKLSNVTNLLISTSDAWDILDQFPLTTMTDEFRNKIKEICASDIMENYVGRSFSIKANDLFKYNVDGNITGDNLFDDEIITTLHGEITSVKVHSDFNKKPCVYRVSVKIYELDGKEYELPMSIKLIKRTVCFMSKDQCNKEIDALSMSLITKLTLYKQMFLYKMIIIPKNGHSKLYDLDRPFRALGMSARINGLYTNYDDIYPPHPTRLIVSDISIVKKEIVFSCINPEMIFMTDDYVMDKHLNDRFLGVIFDEMPTVDTTVDNNIVKSVVEAFFNKFYCRNLPKV